MADHNFLLRELPEGLKPLAGTIMELATDLRWTWSHAGDELWKAMAPDIWDRTENPYVVLQNMTRERIQELDNNSQFKERLLQLKATHSDYCSQRSWYDETYGDNALKGIAYFSMEFGLGEALPLYAGGLGVLAGDHLKAASDMGLPLIAIGLLYQEGYFRQVVDSQGRQQEIYNYNDSSTLPIISTPARSGAWLHIPIDLPGRQVWLRVWQAQIGRITLYLLDSNDPLNYPSDRGITGKLYGGGQEMRLAARNGSYTYQDGRIRATLSPGLAVQEMALRAVFEGSLALQPAAEMILIFEGIRRSLPFLGGIYDLHSMP